MKGASSCFLRLLLRFSITAVIGIRAANNKNRHILLHDTIFSRTKKIFFFRVVYFFLKYKD